MGAIATLEQTALEVAPGTEVSTAIRVRNAGSVVDEFTFQVIGEAAGWTVVEPDVLRLLPGDEEQARVVMRPPRGHDVAAGDVPFGIRVDAREDPDASVVEEGIVGVGAFAEVTADLVPHTSQGARRGRHELAVDNRGNDLLQARIAASDEDDKLDFTVAEPRLRLEPGTAAFTYVDVRPHERFWRGPNKTLPFVTEVSGVDGQAPVQVDGTFVQRAILPPWFFKALLAVLALLLLGWLLWATLLQPTIESTAQEAAEEALETPLAEQSEALAAQDEALAAQGEAQEEALAAQDEALAEQGEQLDNVTDTTNELAEEVGAEPVPTTAPSPPPVEANTDIRLSVSDSEGGDPSTDPFTVPDGNTFRVSDIVLQNPVGNEGTIRVLRNGDPLLEVALQNFRDLDYHFVTPLTFNSGDTVALQVDCTDATAPGADECAGAALVSGLTESGP